MAIANNKDLTHVVRTTQQWQSSYDKYECIPEGVLCIEFTTSGQALAKIGNGRDIFSKLPYIGGTDLTNYYTKSETAECVEEIIKANRFIRIKGILQNKDQLPSHAECGDLYFVISQNQSSSNKYDEYVYSPSNTWENLGSIPIDIDLSEYAKIVYVDEKIDEVNERIDDIERHGTHTHANKDILDLITAAFTAEEKDKLSALYNYDDTELRKLITKASHTHSNKDILDAISAPFTKEDKSKLDRLNPYDDSILKEKIQALERLAHEHSNKRILDRTTASFTTEYERKMRWIRLYTGCTGMEEGIAGLVPAAQAGEEDYVLSGSGEWVPQTGGGGTYELPIATTSTLGGIKVGDGLEIDANGKLSVVGGGGGGDSIAEGDGITIATDPQTGVKTISVNTGDHLKVDENTGELNVTDVDYEAGQGIRIGSNYNFLEYIKNSGNYDQIILTDILPKFSDALEVDVMFGAASGLDNNREFIGTCNYDGASTVGDPFFYGMYVFNDNIRTSNITFYNHFVWTPQCTNTNFIDNPYGIDYYGNNPVRQIARMQGNTGSWGNVSRDFSDQYRSDFVDPFYPMAIFGSNHNNDDLYQYICGEITLYGVKLYDSLGTLIHDLRPAERGTDGEAGLYDLVTHKFYGNAGNGSFVKGPPISSVDNRLISAKIGNGLQFDSNNAIEVNTGDGLSVNQDNELEVNLGSGLQFDANGAIEVTSSGGTDFVPGEGLEMVQEGYFDRLPLETYSHCDYVENTNNAYCQINYIPPQNVRVIGKFSPTQTLSDGPVFGSRTSNNTNGHQFVLWCSATSGNLPYKMGFVTPGNNWGTTSEANSGYVTSFVPNDIINVDADLLNDRFLVNNELLHPLNVSSSATASLNLNIFNCNYSGSTQYKFCGKIYELKFYVGNALAVNLVPAVRDSDNVIGFYDNVNDVFYPSIGNTAFSTDTSTITKHEPSVGIEDVLNVKPATTGNIGGIIPRRALSIDLKGRLDVDLATSTTPGIVIPKEGLNVNANGEVSVAKATSSTMGGLKIGSGIIQAPDGTVNVSAMEPFDIGDGLELEYDSEDALPSGYAYVDYISSNPTSATTSYGQARTIIDYVPNANTRYKVRGSRNNNNASTSRNYFCGAKQSANDYQSALLFTNNGTNKSDVGFLYGSAQWADTKYNIDYVPGDTVVIEADANSLKVDGTTVATYTPAGNPPAFKIGVFGATANGNVTPGWTDNNPMNGKIYYLKIYEGDTLVVNLIPAYRYADDAVGFYDNINDKFYTSITNYPFTTDISTLNPDPENRKLNVVPATANTIGGIKVGDGLSIESDGTLSVVGGSGGGNYSAGEAIEFETVTDTHDIVWNMLQMSHTWVNKAYTAHVGGIFTNDSLCVHSDITPISNLFSIPQNGTIYTIEARDQNDNLLHCIVDYHDGAGNHLDWNGEFISDPTKQYTSLSSAIYISVGVVNTDHSTPLAISNVKSVTLTWKNVTETSTEINVKYGNGLTVNQDNELEVNLGDRLHFDSNNALAVNPYYEGEGISIHTMGVPTGYTRVKALSSTDGGNQYIDTGYKINPNTVIELTAVFYKYGSNQWKIPLGTRNASYYASNGMLFLVTWETVQPGNNPSLWIERVQSVAPSDKKDEFYNDIVNIRIAGTSLTCTNTRTGVTTVLDTETAMPISQYNLFVFAINDHGNMMFHTQMDLYSLTISEADTIIHQYIPCRRDSDNKYGLYDAIDQEFKLSPNNALFTYVAGAPSGDTPLMEEISLLPATDDTLGGIKIGDGLAIDEDGVVSTTNIEYEAGQGIEFITTESGDSFNVKNKEYYFTDAVSCQINGTTGPRTYTRTSTDPCLLAIAQAPSRGTMWTCPLAVGLTENSVKYSNSYDGVTIGPDDSFEYKGYTWYITWNYGLMNSTGVDLMGNVPSIDTTSIDISDRNDIYLLGQALIDAAELIRTVVSMDVWTGVTGWTNGDYYSGTSDSFTTDWYYTYHYDPTAYIPVPEGALKVRVIGISNENDSHFEGGGANIFDSNHHHIGWLSCCTATDEWRDIPEGTVYVQPEVKWNNSNTRTISSSDIKSVTLQFWYSDPRNNAITAKLGNGLEFDQDDAIQVKLGDGLAFDEDGAIEVTGGGGGGDSIDEGDGITITTDSQTGVKTIGINVGDGLDIDPITNELFVNGQLPEGTIIKKLTYMGDGGANTTIQFDKKPLAIITLYGQAVDNKCSAVPTVIDANVLMSLYGTGSTSQSDKGGTVCCEMSYDDSTNVLTLSKGYDAGARYNISGETYQMFYLTKGHTGSGTSVNNEVSVIKTFSYVGDGTGTIDIQFSETPDMIVSIYGPTSDGFIASSPVPIASTSIAGIYEYGSASRYGGVVSCGMSFNDSTNILTLSGGVDAGARFNISGATYTVTYSVNEVIASTMPYDAGEAISIETIGGLQPTNYSNDDFVDSIASINGGTIVKAADNSSFTLTASLNDCYTRGSSGQANGLYPFNVKASTKYRFAWDSADPDKYGVVYVFENGQYGNMMHTANQHDASYIEFTTTAQTSYIQARFGVAYAGNSITYSNVRLYEVIKDEDQYDEISVKYNKGLSVNQNNELEVNIGTGLAFDPQTGAINVTGGGGGSGDTVAEGAGIEITTDQQTGNKVIAVNAGTGLQVDQTTNELEIDDSVLTEDDELNLVFVPDDYQPS